jgi:hypothetical protein
MNDTTVWTRWEPGPEKPDGPVVVAFTCFTYEWLGHVPAAARSGLRLREGWFAMQGAVGLWLWLQPLRRRSGSVSVWTSEEDLRRFVSLPLHVAIMKRFRPRGEVESRTWRAEEFDAADVKNESQRLLTSGP